MQVVAVDKTLITKRVACVGVGLIGHGWATLFAWKGYDVAIYDINDASTRKALHGIKQNLILLSKEDLLGKESLEACYRRVKVAKSLDVAVSDAQYIQESVYEKYKIKKEVFKMVDRYAPKDAIIASSSSTLKMTNIQKSANNPERCVLVHPWNPTYLMPLVEIVSGKKTSKETVKNAKEFMTKLGKVAIVQKKEVNGTIGNRLAAALWREAIDLVYKDVAELEDIDKAVNAGPGMRWAIIGPHLSYHLGGGSGGIEYYLHHIGPTMASRWRTLAKWTSIPPAAEKKIIEGMKRTKILKEKSIDEVMEWRDRRLAILLKSLYDQ